MYDQSYYKIDQIPTPLLTFFLDWCHSWSIPGIPGIPSQIPRIPGISGIPWESVGEWKVLCKCILFPEIPGMILPEFKIPPEQIVYN